MIFVDRIAFGGGGPIALQGNWQNPTFHGHPTLNYNYGFFDGCSYRVYNTITEVLTDAHIGTITGYHR